MADYRKIIPFLLSFEGGYVNDPSDSGGETNKGVTWATYEAYCFRVLNVKPTHQHFKTLTDDEVGRFFKLLYWDELNGDNIPSQAIAEMVSDWAYNSGERIAAKELQRCLYMDFGFPLMIDGDIGPKTIAAISQADEKTFAEKYTERRMAYYDGLAERRPKDKKYIKGWLNRAVGLYKKLYGEVPAHLEHLRSEILVKHLNPPA